MKGISVKIKLQGEKKRHCSLWELSTVMTRAQHRTENQLQCIFSKAGRTSPNIQKSSHGYPETYFSRSKMKSLDEFYLFVRIWRVTIILWGFHWDIVNLFLCLFLLFKKRINTLGWLILCVTCSSDTRRLQPLQQKVLQYWDTLLRAKGLMGKPTPKCSSCPRLLYFRSTPFAPIRMFWCCKGASPSHLNNSHYLKYALANAWRRQPGQSWYPYVPSEALTWSISSCSLSASSSVSSLILGSFASCFASLASFAALSAFSRRSASWRAFFSFRSFWASLLWWLKESVISWKAGMGLTNKKNKEISFFFFLFFKLKQSQLTIHQGFLLLCPLCYSSIPNPAIWQLLHTSRKAGRTEIQDLVFIPTPDLSHRWVFLRHINVWITKPLLWSFYSSWKRCYHCNSKM